MVTYKVKKRNNKIEELDIREIRKAIDWAVEGLELNSLELESHVNSIYNENITTSQIQNSLVDTAIKMTSVDEPDWRFVAARLLLMEVYKEVAKSRKYNNFGYGNYLEFLEEAVKSNLYSKKIFELYTKEELKKASEFIKNGI